MAAHDKTKPIDCQALVTMRALDPSCHFTLFSSVFCPQEGHKAIREDPAPAPKEAFTPDRAFKNTVNHTETTTYPFSKGLVSGSNKRRQGYFEVVCYLPIEDCPSWRCFPPRYSEMLYYRQDKDYHMWVLVSVVFIFKGMTSARTQKRPVVFLSGN